MVVVCNYQNRKGNTDGNECRRFYNYFTKNWSLALPPFLPDAGGREQYRGQSRSFWFHVYLDHGNDRVDFACGGTGEILIDRVWRVGYWGDRASLSMMAELAAVLGKQEKT